ncbi:hypothetical protein JKP88DRAFT_241322 [Tribonema minus]|uniref:Uncharacterized protein n=1 Tax=Tribonema minus TaxID=303371 RepID=A0A836CE49_9STRA|nr:hypothetical protein JKP88DRAFT_241322 [Tribonema minus]
MQSWILLLQNLTLTSIPTRLSSPATQLGQDSCCSSMEHSDPTFMEQLMESSPSAGVFSFQPQIQPLPARAWHSLALFCPPSQAQAVQAELSMAACAARANAYQRQSRSFALSGAAPMSGDYAGFMPSAIATNLAAGSMDSTAYADSCADPGMPVERYFIAQHNPVGEAPSLPSYSAPPQLVIDEPRMDESPMHAFFGSISSSGERDIRDCLDMFRGSACGTADSMDSFSMLAAPSPAGDFTARSPAPSSNAGDQAGLMELRVSPLNMRPSPEPLSPATTAAFIRDRREDSAKLAKLKALEGVYHMCLH